MTAHGLKRGNSVGLSYLNSGNQPSHQAHQQPNASATVDLNKRQSMGRAFDNFMAAQHSQQ